MLPAWMTTRKVHGYCCSAVAVMAVAGCSDTSVRVAARPAAAREDIASGQTFAGTRYVATVEMRKKRREPTSTFGKDTEPPSDCSVRLTVREGGHLSSSEACYSSSKVSTVPSVECLSGLLIVQMESPTLTRRVRLRLSNGESVTSPAMAVPRRLGGPATLYYQAVRGQGPRPVSVTELDAHGRILRTLPTRLAPECTKIVLQHLGGSGRVLVRGLGLDGREFALATERTRILGKTFFGLRVIVGRQKTIVSGAGILRLASPVAGIRVASPTQLRDVLPLEWGVTRVCGAAHTYWLMYGVLTAPHDKVFVRDGGQLIHLHRVPIPATVRPKSVLVYGSLSKIAGEIAVRTQTGATIISEDIGASFSRLACM
jgi:hypothetical protein